MKKNMPSQSLGLRIFYGAVVVIVTVVAFAGLFVAGSPSEERARRADDRRVNDLQQISYSIDAFWTRNDRLPETLEELRNTRDIYVASIHDPETGEPYEYRIIAEREYELCANFATDTDAPEAPKLEPFDRTSGFWSHEAERTCFTIEVRSNDERVPQPVR